jgi:hypothetical protein
VAAWTRIFPDLAQRDQLHPGPANPAAR